MRKAGWAGTSITGYSIANADRLTVSFAYDALGRRLYKKSHAKYRDRRQAGPVWNENQRRELDEQLGCGFTWYVWEGDTLAFECRDRERHGRSTHYVFEPGTFVPVAQAVSNHVVELIPQPVYVFPYDIDKDPVWQHKPTPKPFDALAWYQCDHLGTPMELTGEDGEIAWRGTYKAWGLAEETRSDKAKWADIRNPLRFQGQYWDVETGLHYNRYRYYDLRVGRLTCKDPIGLQEGLNTYQYSPNPVLWVDPLGLSAASDLPKIKGQSVAMTSTTLTEAGSLRSKHNGINETWKHLDGSEVRVHKYGSKCPCAYKSGNNARVHKEDPTSNQLNDRGFISQDPNQTHIGIRNPADLPTVRGRQHGS